jgi:hypothetical protein
MTHDESSLLFTARESKHSLLDRVRALEALAHHPRPGLAPQLRDIWNRRRRPVGPAPINYDPEAAERVVDLYVIYALYRCGDDSLLPQIAVRVTQGTKVLTGPEDERVNAAKVIRAIGRPDVVEQVVRVTVSPFPNACANAVRTLQLLQIPSPPTGGPVTGFAELAAPVDFTIHRLSEELKTIADLSGGRISLSPGVTQFMAAHDYDRGEVHRKGTSLAEILTDFSDTLDVAYAVTPDRVVICTFQEAGERWRRMWPDYSRRLQYDAARQAWHF